MGVRSTQMPAPVRIQGARDARMMLLPPLPLREDVAEIDDVVRDEEMFPAWWNERSSSDSPRNTIDSLRLPESASMLDFSAILPSIDVPAPIAPVARKQTDVRSRAASASVALVNLGKARPVVRIPAKGNASAQRNEVHAPASLRLLKLPPVWLLANVLILIVATIAVVPHVISVDAAAACKWHSVVPGDTLGNIGWANHTDAMSIARANHLTDPNLIYVGQNLCIPMTGWAAANSAPKVPATTQPPRFGTANNVRSFINLALPYAREAHNQTGWPVSMILAQWGLEHGWSIPGFTGYNWGNSGAVPGFPAVSGTNVPGSPAAFAYASSPHMGVQIYVHCAKLSYYTSVAWNASHYGADAATRALGNSPWDAGHYTAVGNPGSSLISIMRVYNLYWYDTH